MIQIVLRASSSPDAAREIEIDVAPFDRRAQALGPAPAASRPRGRSAPGGARASRARSRRTTPRRARACARPSSPCRRTGRHAKPARAIVATRLRDSPSSHRDRCTRRRSRSAACTATPRAPESRKWNHCREVGVGVLADAQPKSAAASLAFDDTTSIAPESKAQEMVGVTGRVRCKIRVYNDRRRFQHGGHALPAVTHPKQKVAAAKFDR